MSKQLPFFERLSVHILMGFILIVVFYVFAPHRYLSYLFVLTGPQYVSLEGQPNIQFSSIMLNDKTYTEPVKSSLSLKSPKKYLQGADTAVAIFKFEDNVELLLFLDLNYLESVKEKKNFFFKENSVIQNIIIKIPELSERNFGGSIFYNGFKDCFTQKVPFEYYSNVIGSVFIKDISQKTKNVNIDLLLNIPITNIPIGPITDCSQINDQVNGVSFAIKDLHIELDSTTIFRWSPKGGATYEL